MIPSTWRVRIEFQTPGKDPKRYIAQPQCIISNLQNCFRSDLHDRSIFAFRKNEWIKLVSVEHLAKILRDGSLAVGCPLLGVMSITVSDRRKSV
jgi:hypothetical protein